MDKKSISLLLIIFIIIGTVSCSKALDNPPPSKPSKTEQKNAKKESSKTQVSAAVLATHPTSMTVVVNKHYYMSPTYVPKDLVYPNVPFLFKAKVEKRKMRKTAARALERMFAGAKKDGIYLSGVSAYRSYKTQKALFNRYVKRDGFAKASTYSALPGTSEHQTGLSIDVSGRSGKCAVSSCFANTKEASWLKENSAKYGFIIRYPKGKESITGYKYEPWHIRYVGSIAKNIQRRGITLEEYFHTYPVSK